jgi:hypothetical protein
MMKNFLFLVFFVIPVLCVAQRKDSLPPRPDSMVVREPSGTIVPKTKIITDTTAAKKDSAHKRVFSPRKAAIYSAILPGAGQVYNQKYWKVPIVWVAIGIPIYQFIDNKKWYDRAKYALALIANNTIDTDSLNAVHPNLKYFVENKLEPTVLNFRNDVRRNMDYSILFALLFWGLQIVDATVDAHLKGFNVSDDLSLNIRPAIIPGPGNAPGISFVLNIGKNSSKQYLRANEDRINRLWENGSRH